jgi:D-amino-acid dehydrogenase
MRRARAALAQARDKIAGGLYCPLDESGDCFQFTEELTQARWRTASLSSWDTRIDALHTERDGHRVETSRGRFAADAFVLALGSYSPGSLELRGLSLPI